LLSGIIRHVQLCIDFGDGGKTTAECLLLSPRLRSSQVAGGLEGFFKKIINVGAMFFLSIFWKVFLMGFF
jgi:hypothetical protein|tara:strand:- start:33 stop:242 length:210 start_codon:yes stop_codon:yes gene_type:complete